MFMMLVFVMLAFVTVVTMTISFVAISHHWSAVSILRIFHMMTFMMFSVFMTFVMLSMLAVVTFVKLHWWWSISVLRSIAHWHLTVIAVLSMMRELICSVIRSSSSCTTDHEIRTHSTITRVTLWSVTCCKRRARRWSHSHNIHRRFPLQLACSCVYIKVTLIVLVPMNQIDLMKPTTHH